MAQLEDGDIQKIKEATEDEPFLNTTGGKVVLAGAAAAGGAALTYVLMPKPNAEGLKLSGGGTFSLK